MIKPPSIHTSKISREKIFNIFPVGKLHQKIQIENRKFDISAWTQKGLLVKRSIAALHVLSDKIEVDPKMKRIARTSSKYINIFNEVQILSRRIRFREGSMNGITELKSK